MAELDLVADGGDDVGHLEGPLLARDLGMEDDLEEQVAQLLAQGAHRTAGGHLVHLLQHLVGLLDEVGPH